MTYTPQPPLSPSPGTAAIVIPIVFAVGWNSLPTVLYDVPTMLLLLVSLVVAIVIAAVSRRRSEDLREAEERFRALVELSPDGIGISTENSTVLFANSALARLLGAADPSQLIGRNTSEWIHPEHADDRKKRLELLHSGRSAPWVAAKWTRLDGTVVNVEIAGVPVQKKGKTLYQGFVRDLSERMAAAAKLEENRLRLQALFDTAINAIIFIDSEGRYVDANPAAVAITGYEREEILKMKTGDLTTADRREQVLRNWQKLVGGVQLQGEFTILRKDGGTREVEYRAVPNVLPGLHCALMHDITARKEAEKSLRQLSVRLLRLQDDERRRIARELHETTAQNLVAIRLNLSRIKRFGASNAAIEESTDESIALTEQSIAEIRTLSYLLHPPLIDEAGLLPSLRWFARGFQDRSGIAVTLEAPSELDRFPPDVETTLFRIVQEALTNVQRHSGSKVAVIRLARERHGIRLEIEDQGRGLPAHLRERGSALAAGVGIAAMQERVRELGGEMQVESEDRGTRIVVTLPIPEG